MLPNKQRKGLVHSQDDFVCCQRRLKRPQIWGLWQKLHATVSGDQKLHGNGRVEIVV